MITRKEAKRIADLIRQVKVYHGMSRDGFEVANARKWHDEAVEELESILQVYGFATKYREN